MEATRERLRQTAAELEYIDAALRIFDPNISAETIKPKAFQPPQDWSRRGEMTGIVLSILRRMTNRASTALSEQRS